MSGIQRPVCAAIDVGTSYSGYAYSLKECREKVYVNDKWRYGSHVSNKTPTCLLLNPIKQFQAFGYKAIEKYQYLIGLDRYDGWYFFRNFKTELYEKDLSRQSKIKDIGGRTMDGMTIFALTIGFLKDHMLHHLDKHYPSSRLDDITFVLTVPSIWSNSAKQFMREAAVAAGIPNDQLIMCLEPEAASIYCQTLESGPSIHNSGDKYLIVDLGGGTVDMTAHKKEGDGRLEEIVASSGGPFGGECVFSEYVDLLQNIFGQRVLSNFRAVYPDEYFELLYDFETQKSRADPKLDDIFTVVMPPSLKSLYEKIEKRKVETAIKSSEFSDYVTYENRDLTLDISMLKHLHSKSLQRVLGDAQDMINDCKTCVINKIILVGGHAKSEFVSTAFRQHFGSGYKIFVPQESDIAVVIGAVVFGHDPSMISTRILKYTYGTDISPYFDIRYHPTYRRALIGGVQRCKDVFDIFITAGTKVKYGHHIHRKYLPTSSRQRFVTFNFYVSDDKYPVFVDNRPCTGCLMVEIPKYSGKSRELDLSIVLGHTEIYVTVKSLSDGKSYRKVVNFL
ncbi:hypothetical protein FSP39_002312 [Pinctada imbricata]|uniref:Uncharacterized protein n=1 Tax=Pinctada imbricata TaxID=66713 RepID=A0AA88Y6S9_PINIB|nr:hypothetical protein FSP39_002312 [Pinctada imbricata]